jgi:hypothetical protein
MIKSYFVKLINYMKNVYNLERGLNKLSDGRINLATLPVRYDSCNQNTTSPNNLPHPFLDRGRVVWLGKEALW